MIRLFLKLLLLAIILIAIKLPFFFAFQDEVSYRRSEYLKGSFDTVFVGSSRTRDAILPSYFDSLNQKATRSYNFGTAAAVANQTLDRCELLINSSAAVKTLIVELSGGLESVQVYEEPWRSFDLQEHWRATRSMDWAKAILYNDRLVATFFKPNVFFGHIDNNVPLEELKKRPVTENRQLTKVRLEAVRKRNLKLTDETESGVDPSIASYLERIDKILKLADSKSVNVYFFIPPRIETDREAETLRSLWHFLDSEHKLDVNHYEETFYAVEDSADEFHLNQTGALKFTKHLAEVLIQKSEKR
jgi:hypothetical protein